MAINDCIFCKIVKGEIPSTKVYEDDNILAFFDINPINEGHTIVIPKNHYKNFLEFADNEIENFFKGLKTVAIKLKENLPADGINILQNNFKAAGQEVEHLHFHIIPRWDNDGLLDDVIRHQKKADFEKLKELQKKLL